MPNASKCSFRGSKGIKVIFHVLVKRAVTKKGNGEQARETIGTKTLAVK